MSGDSLDGEVWRYRDFIHQVIKGNDYYGPFDMDYIEGYRRTNRAIFLDQKWEDLHNKRPEKATWHDNVLRLGHLIAHDSHGGMNSDNHDRRKSRLEVAEQIFKDTKLPTPSGYWEDDILTDEEKERAWKNFLGRVQAGIDEDTRIPAGEHTPGSYFWLRQFKLSSGAYSGNVDLMAWLPTNGKTWLHRGDGNQQDGKSVNSVGEFESTIGKDGMINQNQYEKFQKHGEKFLDQLDPIERLGSTFQAIYDGELPVKYIKKVNDHDLTDGWVEFSEYLNILRKNYIFQLDEVITEIVVKDDAKQQLKFLNNISDDLRKLQYYLNEISEQVKEMKEKKNVKYFARIQDSSGLKENFEHIIMIIEGKEVKGEGYSSVRKRLISKMDEELNYRKRRYESPFNEGIDTEKLMYKEEKINNVGEFLANTGGISNKIGKIIREAKELAEEKKRRKEGEQDLEIEEEFLNNLDRRLTNDILEIPNLRPIVEKMEKKT